MPLTENEYNFVLQQFYFRTLFSDLIDKVIIVTDKLIFFFNRQYVRNASIILQKTILNNNLKVKYKN